MAKDRYGGVGARPNAKTQIKLDVRAHGLDGASTQEVVEQAQGQTVDLWMYGGDEQGNRYVDEVLAPAFHHGSEIEALGDEVVVSTDDVLAQKTFP